jgi:drug/metabolite transporter (DMT)-like permease
MGRLDNLPENGDFGDSGATTESLLQTMANDLRSLQQDVVSQLHQDVQRLQAEKSRLISDIEKLQNQRQIIQSQHEMDLSRQQIAQQQAWAKQLALALANHLHTALAQRLSQSINPQQLQQTVDVSQLSLTQVDPEQTQRVLASIDETVNRAFTSLNHDLSSYQSALSQQINRMHDLGQQGEAILEVLVGRISQQLQSDVLKRIPADRISTDRIPTNRAFQAPPPPPTASPQPTPPSIPSGYSTATPPAPVDSSTGIPPTATPFPPAIPPGATSSSNVLSGIPLVNAALDPSVSSAATSPALGNSETMNPTSSAAASPSLTDPSVLPPRSAPARKNHPFRSGVIFILFSAAMLALHYVIVQIIGTEGRLFGNEALPIGGFISLATFSSALLVLWVRMVAIVPLLAWLAGLLYQPVWRDVKLIFISKDRRTLWSLIGSGIFLMLSQVFLYIAIGEIGPAVAATLTSIYPLATIPLTWILFGDRPTRLKVIAIGAIGVGAGLALFAAQSALSNEGIVAGVLSSITFALYLVSMLIINRRKLNPVPISLIQNSTIFVLSSVFLIALGSRATPSNWPGLVVGGLILGGLTIVSYFLNDVGSRLLGPARATLITASVPTLTALLAFLILPIPQNSLSIGQITGILVLTMGSAVLSFERVIQQTKAARQRMARSEE